MLLLRVLKKLHSISCLMLVLVFVSLDPDGDMPPSFSNAIALFAADFLDDQF